MIILTGDEREEANAKLGLLFRELKIKHNFVAWRWRGCCGSCQAYSMAEASHYHGRPVVGTNLQDKRHLMNEGVPIVWLQFGWLQAPEMDDLTVGKLIKDVAVSLGLKVDWNEDANTKIGIDFTPAQVEARVP
jgi:hypothetical protein